MKALSRMLGSLRTGSPRGLRGECIVFAGRCMLIGSIGYVELTDSSYVNKALGVS